MSAKTAVGGTAIATTTLPYTGLELWIVGVIAFALLLAGTLIIRNSRKTNHNA